MADLRKGSYKSGSEEDQGQVIKQKQESNQTQQDETNIDQTIDNQISQDWNVDANLEQTESEIDGDENSVEIDDFD